jgi:hypothetical protein
VKNGIERQQTDKSVQGNRFWRKSKPAGKQAGQQKQRQRTSAKQKQGDLVLLILLRA